MSEANTSHEHHRTEEILNHIRLAIKNLEMIQEMVEAQKPCLDIVSRLSGALNVLNETRGLVAKDHLASCLRSSLKPGQESIANELNSLITQFTNGITPASRH